MSGPFATLTFTRQVAAPVATLWQVWTAPAARAIWSAPAPSVTVDCLEADTRVGGREVSLCKVDGQPDIRCDAGWLVLQPDRRCVFFKVISSEGASRSAALVTADLAATGDGSRAGPVALPKCHSPLPETPLSRPAPPAQERRVLKKTRGCLVFPAPFAFCSPFAGR
jgi:uncharacterized protein YndB with AHSA1/START domain